MDKLILVAIGYSEIRTSSSPVNRAQDPNQFAHQENQPGQGDRMDGTSPKAYADVKEAFNDLFAQYKRFVAEN